MLNQFYCWLNNQHKNNKKKNATMEQQKTPKRKALQPCQTSKS